MPFNLHHNNQNSFLVPATIKITSGISLKVGYTTECPLETKKLSIIPWKVPGPPSVAGG